MQEKFNHTPLASLLQLRAEKLTQEESAESFSSPSAKYAQHTALSSSTSIAKAQFAPLPNQGEEGLFLQAMRSLLPMQKEKRQATAGRKQGRPAKQKRAHKHAERIIFQDERASFGQLMSQKFPQKKSAKYQKAEVPQGNLATERPIESPKPEVRSQDTLSMQELLMAQDKASLGQDNEGMEAFFTAMKEVHPLTAKGRDVAPEVQPSAAAQQGQEAFAHMLEKKLEFSLALKGEYMEGHVVGLDELTMNNLRAGVYSPEAHLDLHGLNAMQAYEAMVGFFRGSWYKGMRTLLLIPGRGKNSPNGISVLREKVQLWLTQEPFKRVVLAFCTAQPVDGGPGTIYVLVRKYKKKGKISWERLPSDPDLY